MRESLISAIIVVLAFIITEGVHHHDDLLIHDDCPVCTAIQIAVVMPIALSLILIFFVCYILEQKTFVEYAASSVLSRIRAPPLK